MATKDSDYDFSCPLCYEEYDTPMRLRRCDHVICNRCTQHLSQNGRLKCPECKTVNEEADVQVDETMLKLLRTYKAVSASTERLRAGSRDLQCGTCREALHSWLCDTCSVKLCDTCKNQHVRDTTQLHTIVHTGDHSVEQLRSLVSRATECEQMLSECHLADNSIDSHIQDLETEKSRTLEFLRRTQQQIVDMINEYFSSIDAAYVDATPEEMDILNNRLQNLREDPDDPISKLKDLQAETEKLMHDSEGLSVETFRKIKAMHVEHFEQFKAYYGQPFSFKGGRTGDETRRFSNLTRCKNVLEAITGYDPDGSIAQSRGVSEVMPTLGEIMEITDLDEKAVRDVLQMYEIQLTDEAIESGACGGSHASHQSPNDTDSQSIENSEQSSSEPLPNPPLKLSTNCKITSNSRENVSASANHDKDLEKDQTENSAVNNDDVQCSLARDSHQNNISHDIVEHSLFDDNFEKVNHDVKKTEDTNHLNIGEIND